MNEAKKKKFKILLIIDIILIIALAIIMFVLKEGYSETAKRTAGEQRDAYRKITNEILQEQWKTIDQFGMANRLVYSFLNSDQSEKSFDALVKMIESDKATRESQTLAVYNASGIPEQVQSGLSEIGYTAALLLKNENGKKEIACGINCVITFEFSKGSLKTKDLKALQEYNIASQFKLAEPAPFRFE